MLCFASQYLNNNADLNPTSFTQSPSGNVSNNDGSYGMLHVVLTQLPMLTSHEQQKMLQ